ncbi:DNA polymerase delta subunit 2-like isoform X2 [Ornithodoros turicata]|uniref:DNA polymerase delta subunit 2-like isoform X2 n=1 Tax=Ornithodoros turicata TaxID=34597 RepID=UPI0031389EFC
MPMACDEKLSEIKLKRLRASYTNNSERFILNDRTFGRQYASFYCARYKLTYPVLKARAEEKWGMEVTSLSDLAENKMSVIVGTLFKVMELQPSILKEISEEHSLASQPCRAHFTDSSDTLVLEDSKQRLPLSGAIDVHSHVTGVPVAVLGSVHEDGRFEVKDVSYAGLPKQIQRPTLNQDKFLVLISGLGLAEKADSLLPFQLFVDYMSGFLGCDQDQQKASKVVRVVIAGNVLKLKSSPKESSKAKFSARKESTADASAARLLDDLLTQLASFMEVDLMSGDADPCSALLPQQPLHHCLVPHAAQQCSILQCVTNPYMFDIDGVRVLGTSGQNLSDIRRYSCISEPIEALARTLEWRHLVPTAPDTLASYPFPDKDPFIMEQCPHIYFAGNQPKYSTKLLKGDEGQEVLLVTVPKFCESLSCVWINLQSLECQPMVFEADL